MRKNMCGLISCIIILSLVLSLISPAFFLTVYAAHSSGGGSVSSGSSYIDVNNYGLTSSSSSSDILDVFSTFAVNYARSKGFSISPDTFVSIGNGLNPVVFDAAIDLFLSWWNNPLYAGEPDNIVDITQTLINEDPEAIQQLFEIFVDVTIEQEQDYTLAHSYNLHDMEFNIYHYYNANTLKNWYYAYPYFPEHYNRFGIYDFNSGFGGSYHDYDYSYFYELSGADVDSFISSNSINFYIVGNPDGSYKFNDFDYNSVTAFRNELSSTYPNANPID